MKAGEEFILLDDKNKDWSLVLNNEQKKGYVPAKYVQLLLEPVVEEPKKEEVKEVEEVKTNVIKIQRGRGSGSVLRINPTVEVKKEEIKKEDIKKDGELEQLLNKTPTVTNPGGPRSTTPTSINKRQSVVVNRLNEMKPEEKKEMLNNGEDTTATSPVVPVKKPVSKPKREKEIWFDMLEQVVPRGKMTENEARKTIRESMFCYSARKRFKTFLAKNPTLKEGRIRKQLLKEIHDTEREYVKSLRIVVEIFLNPIKKAKLIKPEQIEKIFGCVENLYQLQAGFLKEMDLEMGAPFPYQPKMGKVFF